MAIGLFPLMLFGVILFVFGMIAYKCPKFWLEFAGARLLIFFKKETRVRILKLIGQAAVIIGLILIVFGIVASIIPIKLA